MAQKYGSTVKNLTLAFSPKLSGGVPIHVGKPWKIFGPKSQCSIFHGTPILRGYRSPTNIFWIIFSKQVIFLWSTEYGSTVKNLTLTFWPKIFSWLPYMYRNSPRKFGRKTQCKIFQGRPVLLGHVFRGTLKKCQKWHVLLNLATRGCHWVKFKFRHASTLGEGHLGQRWRLLDHPGLRN